MKIRILAIALVLVLTLAGCADPPATKVADPTATATEMPTVEPSRAGLTLSPEIADITILALRERNYGGTLEPEGEPEAGQGYTRDRFWFTSDGLRIAAYVDRPIGAGPFPAVIVLHGYDSRYAAASWTDYTDSLTAALAQAGFLAIHPNLRSFAPSDSGPNRLCAGFAIDVLNLIAIVREQAGTPGLFESANGEGIGLWGHSMGGGVVQRVLAAGPDVDAAVLYASIPGDEQINFVNVYPSFTGDLCQVNNLVLTEADLAALSPSAHLEQVQAAVLVVHGETDGTIPVSLSRDLCDQLQALGKSPICQFYPEQGHVLTGEAASDFQNRTIDFYTKYLTP